LGRHPGSDEDLIELDAWPGGIIDDAEVVADLG